ncbi:nuclear transport factor 2 family protein [Sphingobacterium spiritivorum]|uniref:nuclear transport factor 2 family protein n=1 Tax=Sphingobacterium spiritivorum TaxID=258 RepID=UPI003DA68B60
MIPSHREIAESFSSLEFDRVLPHLSDYVEWHISEKEVLKGKAALVAYSEELKASDTTNQVTLDIINIIEDDNNVVIQAKVAFGNEETGGKIRQICTVYDFDDLDHLHVIRTYTLTEK